MDVAAENTPMRLIIEKRRAHPPFFFTLPLKEKPTYSAVGDTRGIVDGDNL